MSELIDFDRSFPNRQRRTLRFQIGKELVPSHGLILARPSRTAPNLTSTSLDVYECKRTQTKVNEGSTAVRQRFVAVMAALDVGTLGLTTPVACRLPDQLRHADEWLAQVGPDRAALALAVTALWLVTLWLAVALVCALAAAAPGGLGRTGQALVRRTMPHALRVAVLGSVGLAVAAAPGVAHAGSNGPGVHISSVAESGDAFTTAARPPVTSRTRESVRPVRTPLPASVRQLGAGDVQVAWPQSDSSGRPAPHVGWPHTPAPSNPTPSTSAPVRHAPVPEPTGSSVTVAPGDSLWLIAAHRLGSHATQTQIAHAWPEWYAANRAVVGANPDHIEPGEHLSAPPPSNSHQKGASR